MTENQHSYHKMIAQLSEVGLNLCASFDMESLPDVIMKALPENSKPLYKSLLLIGTKGGLFWQHLKNTSKTTGHCFDQQSEVFAHRLLLENFPQVKFLTLYPDSEYVLPLQKLGQAIGWGRRSVLGLDIHPDYGTWFAYRVALLISESLPMSESKQIQDACLNCIDKPCITACPAFAVKQVDQFNITACIDHRLSNHSPCADRCFARLACPVGLEFKYEADQLSHHGLSSLASIKQYQRGN